jgi:ferredoxin
MAKRKIIKIDEEKCTGCGECIPACPEGALQIIDGKARLISDLFCDGLGACIGHCPYGAITIGEREAEKYDERKVMENIVKQGENVIKAHLEHLRNHGQMKYLKEALDFLKEKGIEIEFPIHSGGCPGSQIMDFAQKEKQVETAQEQGEIPSHLTHWPIQLHLIMPLAPYFKNSDLVIAADCTAFSFGDFHRRFLKGKRLIIACPKLDSGLDIYEEKIRALIDEAKINTLTVVTMEVPCCFGLLQIVKSAQEKVKRKVPIKHIVIGIKGNIKQDEWI